MATLPTNQKKIHGYKIVCNNLTKVFQVNLKEKVIFFNITFFEKLTDIELNFCVRWAKVARLKRTVNITEIDQAVIAWFTGKYGNEAFNCFLQKIEDLDTYHRLSFGHMKNNAKLTRWQKLKSFFAKKK
jgi:hypothetical protein